MRPTILVADESGDDGAFTAAGHLGISGRTPELLPGLTVEAELSVLLVFSSRVHDPAFAVADNSSYLRLHWKPAAWSDDEGLSLTVLPLHAERLYLGYEFPLTDDLDAIGQSPVTGAELRLARERWYVFASFKTENAENFQVHEEERQVTFFGGAGVDLFSALRIEAEGARAEEGFNPEEQVLGLPIAEWGVAARVMFHRGLSIGPQTDYARYQRDPAVWEKLLQPELYDDALSASVAAELLYVKQGGLASTENFGWAVTQSAPGYALDARLKWRRTRFYLRAQVRSLALIQADALGFPADEAFSSSDELGDELSATVAADHAFELTHLTPGIEAGLTRPASFTPPPRFGGNNPSNEFSGTRAVVFTDTNQFEALPVDAEPGLIAFAKLSLRWDLARFSALAEASYRHDANQTAFVSNQLGVGEPAFANSSSFTFDVLVQARF